MIIKLYTQHPETKLWLGDCNRCDGSGHYSFNRMYGTRCFKCEGRKVQWYKTRCFFAQPPKEREAKHIAKVNAKVAKAQALWDANPIAVVVKSILANGKEAEITSLIAELNADSPKQVEAISWHIENAPNYFRFAQNANSRLEVNEFEAGIINAGRSACVAKLKAKIDAIKASELAQASAPVIAGRVKLVGSFKSVKAVEHNLGYTSTCTWKGLFQSEQGHKVWMSIPSAILSENLPEEVVGKTLTLTVTIEASKDAGFYFGKRPVVA
jgi:hypothetical protein